MPVAKVQLSDGRVARFEVPEGTTQDQVMAAARKMEAEHGLIRADAEGDNEAARQHVTSLDQQDKGFSALNMVKNIPGSGWQYLKDFTTPFIHPVDTAKSLQTIGQGVTEKFLPKPDLPEGYEWGPTENEQVANAVGQYMKDRYGEIRFMAPPNEKVLKSWEQDPVGMMSDLSGMLMLTPAAQAGKVIDPINMTRKVISKAVPKTLPRSMYESAAKFSTTIDTPARKKMVDTAVKKGIMPTQKGVDKINDIVARNSRKIDDLIDAAEKAGRRISRKDLFRHIDDLKKELTGPENLYGTKNAKTIDKVVGNYLDQLDAAGIDDLTPSQVQQLKKNIYQEINFNVTRGKGTYAKEATGKAVARGARESVEEMSPEIAPLNKEAGDLLDIRDAVTRSANRIENRDFIGIDPLAKMLPAQAIAGQPGAVAGAVAAIGGYPKVKARTALLLEALRRYKMGDASIPAMMTRQAAVQAGRGHQANEDIAKLLMMQDAGN